MRPETLADLIHEFGEERYSRRIARRIAAVREKQPIRTARDLARVVTAAIPRQYPPPRIHPATRTFQALRIAVNEELKSLRIALERIPTRLAAGGRLAVISFHSLEDRLVKQAFRNRQVWEPLTHGPVEASPTRWPATPAAGRPNSGWPASPQRRPGKPRQAAATPCRRSARSGDGPRCCAQSAQLGGRLPATRSRISIAIPRPFHGTRDQASCSRCSACWPACFSAWSR